MRIAQVVTLISPDAAYGGPVRVAINQLKSMASLGHQTHLYAAHRGYRSAPNEIDGITLTSYPATRLIPKTGFSGLTSMGLLVDLYRQLRNYDVVHVHLARDLITLPAAKLALSQNIPLVLQTHGMIDASAHPLAKPLDAVWTRPVLQKAGAVLYLTEREKIALQEVSRKEINLIPLANGVHIPAQKRAKDTVQPSREVLFLARLHPRKRAVNFVKAAIRLLPEFQDTRFTLVGPDEGDGGEVARLIRGHGPRINWEGPLSMDETIARMAKADIYVLPSVDEPFPMSVLEAASLGLPLIITNSCGLAATVAKFEAGMVIPDSEEALANAMRELLASPQTASVLGRNALTMVAGRFEMIEVARKLLEIYSQTISGSHDGLTSE